MKLAFVLCVAIATHAVFCEEVEDARENEKVPTEFDVEKGFQDDVAELNDDPVMTYREWFLFDYCLKRCTFLKVQKEDLKRFFRNRL